MIGNYRNLLLHITGSLAFLVLPFLFSPDGSRGFTALREIAPMQRDFLTYLLLLGIFYANYFFIVPKLYLRRRYALYAVAVVVCYLFMYATPRLLIPMKSPAHIQETIHNQQTASAQNIHFPPPPEHFLLDPRYFFLFCFIILLSLVIRLNNRWKHAERDQLRAEVSALKAQINPHFLFNILNTIYALALDRSEKTADAVVKLSGMMRHVVNETGDEQVELEKEINYLIDYVELQRIRFEDALQLEVRVSGQPQGKKIVPALLMPLIENAFKFGVNPEEHSDIRIHIAIEEITLRIDVYNRKVKTINGTAGTHIQQIRDRLQLIYPGKHLLMVRNTSEDFLISLTLQVE